MKAEQIDAEALKLDRETRARLMERLFLSLDEISTEEWNRAWGEEAHAASQSWTPIRI